MDWDRLQQHYPIKGIEEEEGEEEEEDIVTDPKKTLPRDGRRPGPGTEVEDQAQGEK